MKKDPYEKERAEAKARRAGKKEKETSAVEQFFGTVMQNAKGDDGYTPIKGKDYFTKSEIAEFTKEVMSLIPKPKNGKDADYELVFEYVVQEVEKVVTDKISKLPKPKDGKKGKDAVVDIPSIVESLLKVMPKMKAGEVDYLGVKDYIDNQVSKINIDPPLMRNGGTNSLRQLTDVDLTGLSTDSQGNYILGGNTIDTLDDIGDVDAPAPANGDVPTFNAVTSKWESTAPPGASGGEANTVTNVGIGGVGLYKNKVGVDLKFKNINAGSSKITVTDDAVNDEVDIDIDPSVITTSSLNNDANFADDQTGAEIKIAYEGEADTNAYTDAEKTKLAGVEASADVTDTTNVTAAGALMDSEVTNLAEVKAFSSADYATAAQGATADSAEQSANKDQANGYAGLDASSKINPLQLPALAISETSVVASEVEQLALTVQEGDIAVRSDENKSYIALNDTNAAMTDWQELLTPTDTVQSVFGRTGTVTAQSGDYSTAQVTVDADSNYVTDAEKVVIGNTSGTNSGDVTVTDTAEIDLTLTGQDIKADIKASSIDETKLDTSVNASLGLADSSAQVTYSATEPASPETDDLWVDTGTNQNPAVRSTTIADIVSLTQAEYDALTPDSETLYVITA